MVCFTLTSYRYHFLSRRWCIGHYDSGGAEPRHPLQNLEDFMQYQSAAPFIDMAGAYSVKEWLQVHIVQLTLVERARLY